MYFFYNILCYILKDQLYSILMYISFFKHISHKLTIYVFQTIHIIAVYGHACPISSKWQEMVTARWVLLRLEDIPGHSRRRLM